MKELKISPIAQNDNGARLRFLCNQKPLSFKEVLDIWATSDEGIDCYIDGLKKLDFSQFYWEHPALEAKSLHVPYEFMVLKTDHFNKRTVDTNSFSKYLNSEMQVEAFDNLGRNAKLVVPTKKSNIETYKHLGAFIHNAPITQTRALFKEIGRSMKAEIEKGKIIWLSTAGLGVIWLHIRLDTIPKYYKIATYKNPQFLHKTR